MNRDNCSLSQSDWKVMEYLWEKSPLTGREIIEKMEEENNWNRSTTLTILKRLEAKGAVGVDPNGSKNKYFPIIKREDEAILETESFLQKIYKGSVSLMVSSLTEKKALSEKEIDELYELLKNIKEE